MSEGGLEASMRGDRPASAGGDEPRVSVVMPCYNARATVDEAITSILENTLTDLELIAVDDGSEDGTAELLREWAGKDERVEPLLLEHAGLIEALNAGWRAARAPLIARMDADDLAASSRLEKQVEFLARHSGVAAVSSLVESFPPEAVREGFQVYLDWLNGLVTPEDIAREIFVESPLPHPSVMVRRGWLERMGGYKEFGWPEDYDLWLRMHLAGARFGKVEEVLLYWREDPERLTRTDSRYSVRNFLRAKAHYLMEGPLADRDAVLIWGAGQMGRRLSKHLLREGAELAVFIDVDPRKIGREKRGRPVVGREELMDWWRRYENPALVSAVGSHAARPEIRAYLEQRGLKEAQDWWAAT